MGNTSAQGFVLGPGEGRAIDLGGFQMTIEATAADTGGGFSLLEADEPPGFGPPMHIHHDAAEVFYVLQGEYIIFLSDREIPCPTGSFIFVPAGALHGFRVGAVPSRKLNVYVPAATVGYFEDLSAASRRGPVTPEALSKMAMEHSMEVVGPVPEDYA